MSDTYVTKITGRFIAASEVVPNSPLATTLATLGAAGAWEVASLTGTGANIHPDVSNPSHKIIYLTKAEGSSAKDPYTEWIYTSSNAWEIIGETTVDLSGYKTVQTAVTDPTASGTTLTAIATISQDTNGEITVTKKNIQDGTTAQKGVVQLQGSIGATETNTSKAVTPKAVRDLVDSLDVSDITGFGAGKTLATLTETDGKISATFQNISITKSQVSDFPNEMTPSSHTHGNITNDGKIGSTANLSVVTTTGGAVTAKSLETNSPSASGTTLSFIDTVSQASDGKITATKKTVSTMGGASSSTAGTAGLVPAPGAGSDVKFLRGDGTWADVDTSDTKVTQTALGGTETSTYPVLLAPTGQTTTQTTTSNFATGATYKPSTNTMSVNISGDAATASAAKSGSTLETAINNKADKSTTVTNVAYDTTNKKITKTINGTTSDVVTVATLKTDLAITAADVKAVRYDTASQGLTDTQKSNARTNIGAASAAQGTKADSAVQDVTIDGTSIVNSSTKVAAIPVASTSVYGVVTVETATI